MSRTIHSSLPRSLAWAGVLTAAALVAPAALHAQSPDGERALLNHSQAPASARPAIHRGVSLPVDAERALMGHSTPASVVMLSGVELAVADTIARPIDGASALMGGRRRTK